MVSKTAKALKKASPNVRPKAKASPASQIGQKRKAEVLDEVRETGESEEQYRTKVATKGGMLLVSFLMTTM